MRPAVALLILLSLGQPALADVIGDTTHPLDLYGNKTVLQQGDLVTVYIVENVGTNSAVKSQDTDQTTLSSTGGGGFLGPLPTLANSGGSDHKVQNGMQQQETMTTTITAHVTSVDQVGNVTLDGARLLVNNGRRVTLKLHGVARMKDVSPDSTITSTRLADANIQVDGLFRRKPLDYIRHFLGINI